VRRAAVLALAMLVVAGGCKKKETPGNLTEANKVAMRPVRLYFEAPNMLLAAETRSLPLPENPAAAIPLVAREMFKGPTAPNLMRLYPPDTVIRAAYMLPDGTAFVDLGGQTLTAGWGTGTHVELMAVYSLVQTVTANFPETKRVRLLINGEPAETLAGHIWLGKSLQPKSELVDPAAR
jgi:spore germination protein GerM